jgi:hypothetical protein
MSNTTVLRPVGVTTAISVAGSSTTATQIKASTNDQVNYASFINTGATYVAVSLGDANVGAAVLPLSGSTTGNFVLPASMTVPIVLAVPASPYYVRLIGSGAGPSIVYITPVGDQT